MELLEVCLMTSYFHFQQKDGTVLGSSLSPVVSNIYMELSEEMAMNCAVCKPSLWLRYMADTSVT